MPSWMPSFFFLPNKPQANYWQKEKFWRKGNKHFWQWVSVFVVVLFMLSLLLTSLDSVWATLCSEIVWMLPDFFSVGWISQFDFFSPFIAHLRARELFYFHHTHSFVAFDVSIKKKTVHILSLHSMSNLINNQVQTRQYPMVFTLHGDSLSHQLKFVCFCIEIEIQ